MYDVKPDVSAELNSIPGVTVADVRPANWNALPYIFYYEVENNNPLLISGSPLSDVTLQIEIWSEGSTSALAMQVDQLLTGMGFRRQFSADVPDSADVRHKTMRFQGIVDARNHRVSSKEVIK